MLVKKIAVLALPLLGALGCGIAQAGSVESPGPEKETSSFRSELYNDTFLYVDINFGYARHNWSDTGTSHSFTGSYSTSNIKGGFTVGANVGYQLMKYFALEGGYFYLPQAKANAGSAGNVTIKSWFAYGAAKGILPINDRFNVFAKLGTAYVNGHFEGTTRLFGSFFSSGDFWQVLAGAGMQFYIIENLALTAQFMYIPCHQRVPDTYLMTGGLTYRFFL